MIEVHCKKDFKGNIDIRSHIAEKAIGNNENIVVTCDTLKGISIYTPDELREPLKVQGPYTSKFGGKYSLWVYKWKGQQSKK